MRTTIDLDETLLRRLRDAAHLQGVPFRALLHRVILRGLAEDRPEAEAPYKAPSFSLGAVRAEVDLVKALQLAATLEDEETAREFARRR